MSAALDDMGIIQYQYLIRAPDGFQAVGDHNNGLVVRQFRNRPLQFFFIFRVNAACGFIQNDNRGVFQYGAGNRNTLLLTAGQGSAALPDQRIIPIGQGGNKFMAASLFRRLYDLFVRGVRTAEFDVVLNRIGKQLHVLEYHADILHQAVQLEIPHIFAANRNPPGVYIPKPGN